jgi:restriction system protein
MERKVPGQEDLIEPIFEALKNLGGSGSVDEIHDEVVKVLKLSDNQIQIMHSDGRTKLHYNLAWARTYLKLYGAIDIKTRGIWVITSTFYDNKNIDKNDVILKVRNKRSSKNKTEPENEVSFKVTEANSYNWREKLINIIKEMNPYSFEEFTKLLLRYIGFEKLKVTQKSNDKGIDGYGIYKINGLVTYKVAFQCKRYTNTPISSSEIRDFRGSLSSEFDRGLFITTSTFSPSAREEAESSGKTLIELIDGENLIEKIAELEIGLKPKTEYEIDFEFYNKYK